MNSAKKLKNAVGSLLERYADQSEGQSFFESRTNDCTALASHLCCGVVCTYRKESREQSARSADVVHKAYFSVYSEDVRQHPSRSHYEHQVGLNVLLVREESLEENRPGGDFYLVGIPVGDLVFSKDGFNSCSSCPYCRRQHRYRFHPGQESHFTSFVQIFAKKMCIASRLLVMTFPQLSREYRIPRHRCT